MFHSLHYTEPFIIKAVLNLTALPSNRTEAQYSKFINIWCAITLQSIFSPQYLINEHVEYLHYSGSVASESTLTTSIDVYSHTQDTVLRSSITWQLVPTPCMGHRQAIVQEHECTRKLRTRRQEISHIYIKNTFKNVFTMYKGTVNCKRLKDI